MQAHVITVEIAGPIGIGLWPWMAWAIGWGHDWARRAFTAFFSLVTLSLLGLLAEGAAVYAPAQLIATAVVWLVQLVVIVLIFGKKSAPYHKTSAPYHKTSAPYHKTSAPYPKTFAPYYQHKPAQR